MPKIVGVKEHRHGPIEACGDCDVIMGATSRSILLQRCQYCGRPFCLDCYPRHDKQRCEVLNRGLRKR